MVSGDVCTGSFVPVEPAIASGAGNTGQTFDRGVLVAYYRACEAASRARVAGVCHGKVVPVFGEISGPGGQSAVGTGRVVGGAFARDLTCNRNSGGACDCVYECQVYRNQRAVIAGEIVDGDGGQGSCVGGRISILDEDVPGSGGCCRVKEARVVSDASVVGGSCPGEDGGRVVGEGSGQAVGSSGAGGAADEVGQDRMDIGARLGLARSRWDGPRGACGVGTDRTFEGTSVGGAVRPVYTPPSKRGPNWARNRLSRDKKKASKRCKSDQPTGVSEPMGHGGVIQGRGAWTCVNQDTVRRLQETRAKRLLEENEKATIRARVEAQKLLEYERSGAIQREARAKVEVLDGQLSGKYSLVGGGRARGWVETVVSSPASSIPSASGGGASVPSLSSGSVSPNSSISVEESVRLVKRNVELEEQAVENAEVKEKLKLCEQQLEMLRGDAMFHECFDADEY